MESIITVSGTSRSGSTMLDLILGNAPDAFSCGEVYAWFRPYRTHHFEIDCSCGQQPCPIWETIKGVSESEFHASVGRELGARYVIDSSKDLCWVMDLQGWAAAEHLPVFNVLIWKDPVDLAYSYWKRGEDVDSWRKSFVGYHDKFLQTGLRFVAINYSAITENPGRATEQVCRAVGLPYFEGKERFWEKQHHFLFGSGGIKEQVKRGRSIIAGSKALPAAFEPHRAHIEQRVRDDATVQRILATLRAHDVSCMQPQAAVRPGYRSSVRRPAWYYARRLQGLLRRYFPEKYDASRFAGVETVPNKGDPAATAAASRSERKGR